MSKKEEQQKGVVSEDSAIGEETSIESNDRSQQVNEDTEQSHEQDVPQEGVAEPEEVEESQHTVGLIKPTKKKFSLFKLLTLTLIVVLLTSVVILAYQLTERERVIQDTQEDLVATYEELTKVQTDSKDMSILILEQQDKLKQYEVDVEEYQSVVEARDGEIEKLKTLVTENEKKVLELQKQLEELDLKFTELKDEIMLFVTED